MSFASDREKGQSFFRDLAGSPREDAEVEGDSRHSAKKNKITRKIRNAVEPSFYLSRDDGFIEQTSDFASSLGDLVLGDLVSAQKTKRLLF